jgi:hypothetical protein
MVYAILFNNVFKAFSSFKNKYVAEIQPAVNHIWLLSIPYHRGSGQYSSLYASVFCITAARVLHVSLTREKTEK